MWSINIVSVFNLNRNNRRVLIKKVSIRRIYRIMIFFFIKIIILIVLVILRLKDNLVKVLKIK